MNNGEKIDPRRPYVIGLLFCTLCVLLCAKLLSLTVLNNDRYQSNNGTLSYEVTVPAVRGRILDRNGTVLADNACSYDLVLHADGLPDSKEETNRLFLSLLRLLPRTDADLLFPLERREDGEIVYHAEVADPDSDRRAHWRRAVYYLETSTDITAPELYRMLTEKYGLSSAAEDGVFTEEETWSLLALRYDMLYRQFSSLNDYTYKTDLTVDEMTAAVEPGYACVRIADVWQRVLPYPGYASHILGTVGKMRAGEQSYYLERGYALTDLVGHEGVEEAFEGVLHGTDGIVRVTTDKAGHVIATETVREPVPGCDVTLTIDIGLQIRAEDALAENVSYVQGIYPSTAEPSNLCRAGAVVVMDPDTCEVLAMASYPTFDLTTFSSDYAALAANPDSILTNRATCGLYAPGSTFKLGVAAAAMTAGTITKNTVIHTTGRYYWKPGASSQNCWVWDSQHVAHGDINVIQAIRVSCNYFFFEVGRRLGIEKLAPYMTGLGLGCPTGIELYEKTGQVDCPETNTKWADVEILNASIGQGTNGFSPLQICNYLCALWNGGVRYNAHVVYSVDDTVTGQSEVTAVTEQSRVDLSPAVLDVIKDGMAQVIEENASTVGYFMQSIPKEVGIYGKTGTAELGGGLPANALFACVAERGDDRLCVLTVLEKGRSGAYASLTAARILRYWYK